MRNRSQPLAAVIYMLDASDLDSNSNTSGGGDGLRRSAEFLLDVLLALQARAAHQRGGARSAPLRLLVAANKSDLFTALPPARVRRVLETEIARLRAARARGLLDSGTAGDAAGAAAAEEEEEREWLGDYSDEAGNAGFEFEHMRHVGVVVDVEAGNVLGGPHGADVWSWWKWIGAVL